MSKPKLRTVEQFVAYIESHPARLGVWRDGSPGRFPALAWLNVHPVTKQAELAASLDPLMATMMTGASFHNRVGIAAGWINTYMQGPARRPGSKEEDRVALFNAAGAYHALQNALVEVRAGVRGFDVSGTLIRLPYMGNRSIDALDRMLDLLEELDSIDARPRGASPRLSNWMSHEGMTSPWWEAPEWVRHAFRLRARRVLSGYPTDLPQDTKVAGFTLGQYEAFWRELLAWGMQMHAAILHGSVDSRTVCPLLDRDDLVNLVSANTGLNSSIVERIVQMLTLDLGRCWDGALTPLVPVDDQRLVPMSSIIISTSPERNLLAIAQLTPHLVGEVGDLLGSAGERAVLATLGRLDARLLVGNRIRILRPDGTHAGDFDIAVCDPQSRTAVIFEVKWGIAADGNAEVYRSERRGIAKREQVAAVREEVKAGRASPRWPQGWPDGNYQFRWYILTRDVLAMRNVDVDGVTVRSHQLLSRVLPGGASLLDLVSLLDSPPEPPPELQSTKWDRIRYGDLRIEIESIGV